MSSTLKSLGVYILEFHLIDNTIFSLKNTREGRASSLIILILLLFITFCLMILILHELILLNGKNFHEIYCPYKEIPFSVNSIKILCLEGLYCHEL